MSTPARRTAETWRALAPRTRDTITATVVAVGPAMFVVLDEHDLAAGTWALWLLLVLTACLVLAFRRVAPVGTAAAAAIATTAAALVTGRDVTTLVVLVAICSAAYRIRSGHLWLTAGALAWFLLHSVLGGLVLDPYGLMLIVGTPVAPVAIGYAMRQQVDRAAEAARLERARAEAARADERTRIARDVHDVVGHHLSAIRLQAVGGRRRLAGDSAEADRALGTIAELSVRALDDIRELLEQLRATAPSELGIADLPELATRLGADELRISVTTRVPTPVEPALGSCVYRLVQEALTNVARHSRARSATVRVVGTASTLVVSVDDPGPARCAPAGDGAGLPGMLARIVEHGGTFEAGPSGAQGWRVLAELPVVQP